MADVSVRKLTEEVHQIRIEDLFPPSASRPLVAQSYISIELKLALAACTVRIAMLRPYVVLCSRVRVLLDTRTFWY